MLPSAMLRAILRRRSVLQHEANLDDSSHTSSHERESEKRVHARTELARLLVGTHCIARHSLCPAGVQSTSCFETHLYVTSCA